MHPDYATAEPQDSPPPAYRPHVDVWLHNFAQATIAKTVTGAGIQGPAANVWLMCDEPRDIVRTLREMADTLEAALAVTA